MLNQAIALVTFERLKSSSCDTKHIFERLPQLGVGDGDSYFAIAVDKGAQSPFMFQSDPLFVR